MCKCVHYSEVEKEIQQHLKRGMLIPILGSGFSRGCNSRSGKVPSGDDYKKYMIDEIMKARGYDSSRRINFEKKQFSEISTIYHKVISIEDQRRYLRNNFTRVELSDEKKKLLEINWPYIYTLNTDDAIEKNSKYNNVIYSNRKIWDDIFDEETKKRLYREQKQSGTIRKEKKIGRNDPCPCGSGKKYKKCCGKNA